MTSGVLLMLVVLLFLAVKNFEKYLSVAKLQRPAILVALLQ